MNRYLPLVVLFFSASLFLACNGTSVAKEDVDSVPGSEDPRATHGTSVKTPKANASGLQTVPNELMQALVDSADYVDYLFYDMDFSMSMDNKQGVMYAIATIGEAPAAMNAGCKPIGRIFYQIKGRNAAEADLYFSKGCTYLVFMKDNAPIYANSMSDVGKTFLNNQFAAIMKNYVPIE